MSAESAGLQEPRYQLEPLGGVVWGVECVSHGGVVRSGLRDALYWIEVHEDAVQHEDAARDVPVPGERCEW